MRARSNFVYISIHLSARTRSFSTGQQRETARSRRSGRNKRAQGVARSRAMDRAVLQTRVCVYGRPCHRPGRVFSCMPSMPRSCRGRACARVWHAYYSADDVSSARQHAWPLQPCSSGAIPIASCVRASAQNAHACMHAHGSADDTASARQHTWPLFAAAALVRRHRALPAIPRSTFERARMQCMPRSCRARACARVHARASQRR